MLRLQRFLKPIVRTIFRIFCRVNVTDLENLPADPPYIIFSNHISWFDPPLIASFLPGSIYFMTMASLFKFRLIGYIIRLMGGFPVKRGSLDRRTVEEATSILARNGIVCIFPEGGIKRLIKGEELRQGISLIAQRANVPLVPLGISGCRGIYNPLRLLSRTAKIKIHVGKPFLLSSVSHLPGKKTRLKTMERIKSEIYGLAWEEVVASP